MSAEGHCYRLVDSSNQEHDLEPGMIILVNIRSDVICVGRDGQCGYRLKWGPQVVRDFRCPLPLTALDAFIGLLAKEYGLAVRRALETHEGHYCFHVVAAD